MESESSNIPAIFYSYDSKELFEHCIECDRYLLDGPTEYFIEKAFRQYQGFSATDVIFEYAICSECAISLHNQMSEESRNRINDFMMEHLRHNSFAMDSEKSPEEMLRHCIITGKPIEEAREYQIMAHCFLNRLLAPMMPYMICDEALDQLAELLSNPTLDIMDDFRGRHFGPPGEFEINPTRRVILV